MARSRRPAAACDRGPQGTAGAAPGAHRDTGVAVVDAEAVVVGGHQERAAGVPGRVDRFSGRLAQPALDLGVPVAYAERPLAVRAEQPAPVEERQCEVCVAGLGRPEHAERVRHDEIADAARGVVDVDELDVLAARLEQRDGPVGVAGSDRLGQGADRLAEPVRGDERGDAHAGLLLHRLDEVREHRARLHRGELERVADQDQPAAEPDRLQQPGHHRQRDHRGLVDHDHVVGQPVVAVVTEPRRRVRAGPQEPVQGDGAHAGQPLAVGGRKLRDLRLYGLLQPGGGLAGRRGEGDADRGVARQLGLLRAQRQQGRDGRRLAGAGPAGEHRRGVGQGHAGGRSLLVVAHPREDAVERRGQPGLVGRGRPGRTADEVGVHLLLLAPVAVEVEQPHPAVLEQPEHRRLGGDQGARGEGGVPRLGVGPREVEQLLGDRGQVDADRATAHGSHDEGHRERDQLLVLGGQRAQAPRDVHVGGVEHAGLVERPQQPARAACEPRVVRVLELEGQQRHEAPPWRPSRRSDSAVTSAAGGRQEKTPAGWPSSSGVSGPHMPRT